MPVLFPDLKGSMELLLDRDPETPGEHSQEALELGIALALKAARQGLSGVHRQTAEQLRRTVALIADTRS